VNFATNGLALLCFLFHLNYSIVYPALSINNTEFVALAIYTMNLVELEFLLCELVVVWALSIVVSARLTETTLFKGKHLI